MFPFPPANPTGKRISLHLQQAVCSKGFLIIKAVLACREYIYIPDFGKRKKKSESLDYKA